MAIRRPRPVHEWDQRNGNATKDYAAPRNRPSAQAQPVLLRKELWPLEDEKPPMLDPEGETVGILKPLWCNACRAKHAGLACKKIGKPGQNRMPKRRKRRG